MLLCCLFVLCLHTFTVTGQCIDKYGYETYIATLDKEIRSIWYQTKFPPCVNGAKVEKIKAKTIHFTNPRWTSWITGISNFTYLEKIFMDQYNLGSVPLFYDLPEIKNIYLSKNHIEEIKQDAFAAVPVQIIVLSRNQITKIGDGAFGNNVKELYLTCNNLTEFSPAWFRNPSVLSTLTIGANKLTSLAENVFENFVNLDSINLRNNQIVKIGSGAFGTVTSFYHLNLSYNNISEIPEDAFSASHVNISSFDIQYNRLSFLSDQLMKKLKVESVLTWANPWQCPCEAKIERWIGEQTSQIKRDQDPNCVYALSFVNKCVPFSDDDLYQEFLKNFISNPIEICPALKI